MATNNNAEVTFEIMEHIGVLDAYDNREQAWTKGSQHCLLERRLCQERNDRLEKSENRIQNSWKSP